MKAAGRADDLTLDVPCEGASDWLRDRGKVSKQWQRELRTVRARIDKALDEVRPTVAGAAEALRVEPIGYDACSKVVELLREAGLDKRTMLGGYADPTMRQWAAIVALYERDNLRVAEACQRLQHDATYELPAVRAELEAASTSLAEAERKRGEAVKSLEGARQRARAECARLGVSGQQPLAEVRLLSAQLPRTFREVSEKVADSQTLDALQLYRGWAEACTKRAASAAAAAAERAKPAKAKPAAAADGGGAAAAARAPAALLSTLARAHAAGLVELGAVGAAASASARGADAATIDWGAAASAEQPAAPGAEIDWGIDAEDAADGGVGVGAAPLGGDEAVEIDWGGAVEVAAGGADEPVEIDWGAAVEASTANESAAIRAGAGAGGAIDFQTGGAESNETWIEVEASGEHGGASERGCAGEAASGAAAFYEDAQRRAALINNLLEVEAFLRQRLVDERLADPQVLSALSAWPEFGALQVGAERLRALLGHVEAARARLDCARTRQLLLIRSSDAYAERLAAEVQRQLDACAKLERKTEEALERVAEKRAEKATTAPRYAELLERTLALRRALADEISRLFDGRAVNIMGQIG